MDGQYIKIKYNRKTREHYVSKGYKCDQKGTLIVRAEDLSIGAHYKVKVKCDYCGRIIDVAWRDYAHYKGDKYSCNSCKLIKINENNLTERVDHLYCTALQKCNESNYELVTKKEEISNSSSRIIYKCPKHGEHEAKIYDVICGKKCPKCQIEKNAASQRLTKEYVDQEIKKYGGTWVNKEEYLGWSVKNLIIKCPECGEEFITSFNSFIKHKGQYCNSCKSVESLGEKKVKKYLTDNEINFEQYTRFKNCKDKCPLPFDFYLPDQNVAIEYDGGQHYFPVNFGGGDKETKRSFLSTKYHDKIKNEYCRNNNIKLIRIPYWEFDHIDSFLDKNLMYSHEDIV